MNGNSLLHILQTDGGMQNDGNPLLMQDIFEFPQGAEQGTPGYLASSAMQRPNEKRDAAVRALIIYPMNALVEDQMTRLRDALDNDEVQKWDDRAFARKSHLFWTL